MLLIVQFCHTKRSKQIVITLKDNLWKSNDEMQLVLETILDKPKMMSYISHTKFNHLNKLPEQVYSPPHCVIRKTGRDLMVSVEVTTGTIVKL